MSKAGKRIIAGAKEAVAFAKERRRAAAWVKRIIEASRDCDVRIQLTFSKPKARQSKSARALTTS